MPPSLSSTLSKGLKERGGFGLGIEFLGTTASHVRWNTRAPNCHQESQSKEKLGFTIPHSISQIIEIIETIVVEYSVCHVEVVKLCRGPLLRGRALDTLGTLGTLGISLPVIDFSPQDKLIKERVPPKVFCSRSFPLGFSLPPRFHVLSCSFTSTTSMLSTALHHKPDPRCAYRSALSSARSKLRGY